MRGDSWRVSASSLSFLGTPVTSPMPSAERTVKLANMPDLKDEINDPVTCSHDAEAGRQRPRTSVSVGGSVAGALILGQELARANPYRPSLEGSDRYRVEPETWACCQNGNLQREIKDARTFVLSVHFSSLEDIIQYIIKYRDM